MVKNLVLLPCHSVWIPATQGCSEYGFNRDEWELVDFQIEGFDHYSFIEQILKALMKANSTAIVIISGGFTKKNTPEISESKSYFALMKKYYDALSDHIELAMLEALISKTRSQDLIRTYDRFKNTKLSDICFENVYCEEYALDSFENLYYALAYYRFLNAEIIFNELRSVTIVGFKFKETRFTDLHWKYLGCLNKLSDCQLIFDSNMPNTLDEKTNSKFANNVFDSERKYGYNFFLKDPFGRMDNLYLKKNKRNFLKISAYQNAPFKQYLIEFNQHSSDVETLHQIECSLYDGV
ncbi:hypothetical protein QEN19_003005 [Hanseniaspora menglaensis]